MCIRDRAQHDHAGKIDQIERAEYIQDEQQRIAHALSSLARFRPSILAQRKMCIRDSYYPSGNMHIGHTYTTVAADTMTRFKKQLGYDAYFLTGTDEHGQKIERKAAQAGKTPKEFVDEIVAATKDLWKLMNIEYDDFIRTTDERHVKAVQKIFKQFYEQGDIYKSSYEGQY